MKLILLLLLLLLHLLLRLLMSLLVLLARIDLLVGQSCLFFSGCLLNSNLRKRESLSRLGCAASLQVRKQLRVLASQQSKYNSVENGNL